MAKSPLSGNICIAGRKRSSIHLIVEACSEQGRKEGSTLSSSYNTILSCQFMRFSFAVRLGSLLGFVLLDGRGGGGGEVLVYMNLLMSETVVACCCVLSFFSKRCR